MLYYLIKPLVQLTTGFYFRNFSVTGKENIPANGPCILVANHPATFLDALLIAAHTKRKIYFLSKSTVFKSRLVKWFLTRLHMIPVYRQQDDPAQMGKNRDTFEKCYAHLAKGGTMLIFPEGVSIAERKLKNIKTGAARIAFGALEKGNTDIKIICIGLNYERNGAFQTNAIINIAGPLEVKDYAAEYNEKPQDAVKKLTAEIATTLDRITVSVEEKETDVFVSRIEEMYKPELVQQLELDKKDKAGDFFLSRKIVDYLRQYRQYEPWKLHEIKQKTDAYFDLLSQNRVNDRSLRRISNRKYFLWTCLANVLYFILGFPLFVFGFVFNILPYQLTSLFSKKMSVYTEFRVALAFAGGMLIYPMFYAVYLVGSTYLFDSFWLNMFLLVFFPLSGLFAYLFRNYFMAFRGKWKMFTMFYRHTEKAHVLLTLRKSIIGDLEKIRMEGELV